MRNATDAVAEFAARLVSDDVPAAVARRSELAILDTIGVSLAGLAEPGPRAARRVVAAKGALPVATVWGDGFSTSAEHAAWANGVAAHALDYDDYDLRSFAHVSAVLTPVVLALGESRSASGAEVVRAFAAGYETMSAIGESMAQEHYALGFHATGTFGALGAAVSASVLLGLDAARAAAALAIAASLASGLRANFGTDTKPLHAGEAAASGIRAAELAAAGFTASQEILDHAFGFVITLGGKVGAVREDTQSLGVRWRLDEAPPTLKLYASCGASHSSIAAALAVRPETEVRAIDEVLVRASAQTQSVLMHHAPTTGLAGKFSLEYCLSTALLDGRAGIAQFDDTAVRRPEAQDLMRKVTIVHEPRYDAAVAARAGMPAKVAVRMGDRVVDHEVIDVPGSPLNPVTDEQVEQKFYECAGAVLDADSARDAHDFFSDLTEVEDVARAGEILVIGSRLAGQEA